MATPLVFTFQGETSACHLLKVERARLYGYVEKEVVDEKGRPCRLATLAADGRTLIGPGGVTQAYFNPDGEWCDRGVLQAIGVDDEPLYPAASSFKESNEIGEEATVEDYLQHNIRLVYALHAVDGFGVALMEALRAGKIFRFPFSYRGGLDPDVGFLFLGEEDTAWLMVGKPAEIRLMSLVDGREDGGDGATDEGEDDEEDLMDFGLL